METKLILQNKGINGISFEINNEKKVISDINSLNGIVSQIREYINFYENAIYIKKYFENLSDNIDKIILESYHEDDDEYSIGHMYHYIMNCHNREAKDILQTEYEKNYGKSTLIFDPTSDFLYIYTKDVNEAKQFLLFVYEKYILPYLNKIENI